ncbi:MAG TPA: hypothetical protein VGE98_07320, partial [Thermoanaerobaculia bacterium]
NRETWDAVLIERGFHYLVRSAEGEELSEIHLEAAIASLHSGAAAYEETDWPQIEELYDLLYALKPTPIVALNRAIAVGQARGPEEGLAALERIPDAAKLQDYPFYPAARGELLRQMGRGDEARASFETAAKLARNPAEVRFLERKLAGLADGS